MSPQTAHATKLVDVSPGMTFSPDKTPLEVQTDLGGVFEFRNLSKGFPRFEITFEEPGAPGAGKTLTGMIGEPILVQMPPVTSTFHGRIVFKKQDGTPEGEGVPFLAKSCPGCK